MNLIKSLKFTTTILLLVFSVGCSNINNTDLVETNTNQDNIDSDDISEQDIFEEFYSLDFFVKEFNKEVTEEEIIFTMKFILSDDSHNYLEENNINYNMYLEYPKDVAEIMEKDKSDALKLPMRSENNDISTVQFKESLSINTIKSINKIELDDYNLIVSNENEDPVLILNGIKGLIRNY